MHIQKHTSRSDGDVFFCFLTKNFGKQYLSVCSYVYTNVQFYCCVYCCTINVIDANLSKSIYLCNCSVQSMPAFNILLSPNDDKRYKYVFC